MTTKHEVGDIFQINPEKNKRYGGCFIVATEIKEWGIQGYLCMDIPDENVVRFKGLAFFRPKWDEIEFVGKAKWYPERETDEIDSTPR